ncbi:MAG: hypothetical protein EA384_12550 [Spirochaetaceae bacterium]|nr:MAG: hypothetical protein EA384_12550 [Spirochaetaceae bacterium]
MKYRTVSLVLSLLLLCAAATAAQQSATVRQVHGKVEYRDSAAAAWRTAAVGDQLPLGATISTGFGARATLEFGYTTLVVEALSRLTLEDLVERAGSVDTDLRLNVGRVRAEVRDAAGLEQNFRLRSAQATASVRGTEFIFDGVNVQVISGIVTVFNRFNQSSTVGGGEKTSAPEDDPPPSGGDYLEQLLAVIPYAPGSEERETGRTDGGSGDGLLTGSLEFVYYFC